MSLKDKQDQVDEWVGQYVEGYWSPHEILARITEEVGELARLVNHLYGPKKKKSSESEQDLGEEMADILFTIFCLANSKHIDLDKSFDQVMAKIYERDNNRFKKKTSK